ncbi:hypothetical protein EBZ38_01975 [bacterium]|nr:hypothetical protein [bacterium]
MSLGVTVYDFDVPLNTNGSPFGVLVDESDETIKDTVFAYYNTPKYYPPFVQLDRKGNRVQLTSIINVISSLEDLVNIYFEPLGMEDLYERFVETFVQLDKPTFVLAVEYTLFELLQNTPKQFLNETSELYQFLSDISQKAESMKSIASTKQKALASFYKIAYTMGAETPYTTEKYLQISYKYTTPARPKLMSIFNLFRTSPSIPFVALASKATGLVMKISNDLPNKVKAVDIKSWVISESNVNVHKKIKGLLFKYFSNPLITLNYLENGDIIAKYESNVYEDIQVIRQAIQTAVEGIVGEIYESSNIKIVLGTPQVENVTVLLTQQANVDLSQIRSTIESLQPHVHINAKILTTDAMLSMLYKSITVHIKNVGNTSTLLVHNAKNHEEVEVIKKYINVLTQLVPPKRKTNRFLQDLIKRTDSEEIVESSNIPGKVKELRNKTGLKIDSKKCQRDRQPVLVESEKDIVLPAVDPPSYILDFGGVKYMCPKSTVPYPGFNVDNTPCCFKKPQRGKPAYIRNTQSQNEEDGMMVQPSNVVATVIDPMTNKSFTTYLIKKGEVVYFLDTSSKLVIVPPESLPEQLDINWLMEVPLSQLLTTPSTTVCANPPDMTKRSNTNIHKPCEHHPKNKVFGYNAKGFPCCFRNAVKTKSAPLETSQVTQYILQRDKILKPGQIGVIGGSMPGVFQRIDPERKYYKVGVKSGAASYASFMNAILYANDVNQTTLEFVDNVSKYLNINPMVFEKLDLTKKYKTLDIYIDKLQNDPKISYKDTVSLMQRMFNVNIIIINVPYVQSSTVIELDYANTKVQCIEAIDGTNYTILLIKKGNIFEVIVELNDKEDAIIAKKHVNTTPLVKFINKFYAMSCKKVEILPEGYPFDKTLHLRDIKDPIKLQLVNAFGKVEMVVTKNKVVIPIHERVPNDAIPTTSFLEYNDFLTYDELKDALKSLKTKLEIRGVTIDNNNNVTAVLTNYGRLVPVSGSKTPPSGVPVLEYKYYKDVNDSIIPNQNIKTLIKSISNNSMARKYLAQLRNERDLDNAIKVLRKGETSLLQKRRITKPFTEQEIIQIARHYINGESLPTSDAKSPQYHYTDAIWEFRNNVYLAKKDLASKLDAKTKKLITNTVLSTKLTKLEKITKVSQVLKTISPGSISDFGYDIIANDIVLDTVDFNFINNIVLPDTVDPMTVQTHESESVMFNTEDLKRFLNKNSDVI